MSKIFIPLLVAALAVACSKGNKKPADTPNSGSITISADEALKPLIEAEVEAFENIYQNAHIKVIYTSEAEAVGLMLKDSARAVIVTRKLAPAEEEIFIKMQYRPRQFKVATGAIALIVNPSNVDTTISFADLRKYLPVKFRCGTGTHNLRASQVLAWKLFLIILTLEFSGI